VRALDAERFLVDPVLAEPVSEDDLEMGRRLLAERSADDVAAALVRLYRARLPAIEDVTDPGERPRDTRPRPAYAETAAPRGRPAPAERDYSRPARPGGKHALGGGAWFRIDVGRAKGADPKWLVPMICRTGGLTKADIGTIRVFDHETKFEISAEAAEKFTADIRKRGAGNPNIEPISGEGGGPARVGGKPDKRTREARKAQRDA
jgi:ATP-dependent RNA helicase DeaD